MLAYKQLTKQVLRNRIFLVLLLLLTVLTSTSFFFVRFSIDGNINRVAEIVASGGDEARYRVALESNIALANAFLIATVVLTAFVFLIFFYRFFRSGRKQIGCLKALGFKDRQLRRFFVAGTAGISFLGCLVGLGLSYPLADVLLQANIDAYGVSGLAKAISLSSVLLCALVPMGVFSLVAFFSYNSIKDKEPGELLGAGPDKAVYNTSLKVANALANKIPVKNKTSARIVLRKPVTIVLLLVAVLSFNACIIIAYSLNFSSAIVFAAQTEGHNYEYLTRYEDYTAGQEKPENALALLRVPADLQHKQAQFAHDVTGLYHVNELYELQDKKGVLLNVPEKGTAIIGEDLQEIYRVRVGDTLTVIVGEKNVSVEVAAVAANAQAGTMYMNGEELSNLLALPENSYNVLLSQTLPQGESGTSVSAQQRIDLLERDAVSNKTSGVINQVIGAVVGCILVFLALFISFQDNTRDMLILHLMGYQPKAIRKMFVDLYRPIVWILFVLTILPGIWIAQAIQKNLSITTGDYMPFYTSGAILLLAFALLTVIYFLVQGIFSKALKRVIKKEDISTYTNVE